MLQQLEKPARGAQLSGGASITDLGKRFTSKGRSVQALSDIDLQVGEGEYLVILGPSGCGKSTLIRCIAGLEDPTAGAIALSGNTVYSNEQSVNVKPDARNVGMVFQSYALWPHMTVLQNVAYPLRMRKVRKQEREERARTVLVALECEHLAGRLPAELSGGQQQRIALARALVYEPEILLLDEPLSNLDALLRVSLRSELLRLHRKLSFTALHITHDQEEALEMGDRVVLMREGRIEQVGAPETVYARPKSPYAADFLGIRNRMPVTVRNGELQAANGVISGGGAVARDLPDGSELMLFARGRHTHIAAVTENTEDHVWLKGQLAQSTLGEGGRRQYIIDADGRQWFAQHDNADIAVGSTVSARIATSDVLLYSGEELVYPRA